MTGPVFTPIRTERLVVRPWREDEAPRLLDILRRPEIVRWLGHPKTLDTVEEARVKIVGMADALPKSEWAFEVVETGVPAGSVMLVDIPHSEQPDGTKLVQIGWYAHPDATGHGYTTEAVQLLVDYLTATKKQHRIHLVIVPENGASVRIAEKTGFTREGIVRGAFFNDGRNHDVVLYSLVRDDPRPWHT